MYERELEVIAAASRQRVGPATSLVNDAIRVAPSELAAKAGFSPAVYAVGRLVHSEYGFGPPAALLAIAEAARNEAARRGVDVVKLLAHHEGYFGRQRGGWASTAQDPTAKSLAAAKIAIEGNTNIAAGAAKFFDPQVSDRGTQAGHAIKDAVTIVRSWSPEGWRWADDAPLYQAGVDPYKLMVFRKSGKGEALSAATRAINAIVQGRQGGAGSAFLFVAGLGLLWWASRNFA